MIQHNTIVSVCAELCRSCERRTIVSGHFDYINVHLTIEKLWSGGKTLSYEWNFTFIVSLVFSFQHTWNLTMDKHWPFMLPPQGSIGQLHTLDPVHLPQRGCQLGCQWYTSYPLFLLCDPCDPCSLMHKDCANISAGQMSVQVKMSKTGMSKWFLQDEEEEPPLRPPLPLEILENNLDHVWTESPYEVWTVDN